MLKICPPNTAGRDFAVGDIHGHFRALAEALRGIGFNTARDRLFSVGDLVDRGPESAQVLDWLAQPWFHAVRGNHEVMACAALDGRDATAQHFHQRHGGGWLHALDAATRQRIGQTLCALPLAIEVPTAHGPVGVVHADLPTDDWQDLREGRYSARDIDICLWSRERFQRQYTGAVAHIRAVVHGHMRTAHMRVLGNVYFIDTHDGGQGHFTLLDLATLQAHRGAGTGGRTAQGAAKGTEKGAATQRAPGRC